MQQKTRKNAGVFSICHLSVPDFLTKKIYRSQIVEIQQRKKRAHYFFQSRSEAKLYKQLSTEKLFILNLENHDLEPKFTTWNPNWEFESEG